MEQLLTMLKVDLGILSTTAYDNRLTQLLGAALDAIRAEGAATVSPADPADAQLIVLYAAWMWRGRDEMPAMPRMLRWKLNNRVLGEKMGRYGNGSGQCT